MKTMAIGQPSPREGRAAFLTAVTKRNGRSTKVLFWSGRFVLRPFRFVCAQTNGPPVDNAGASSPHAERINRRTKLGSSAHMLGMVCVIIAHHCKSFIPTDSTIVQTNSKTIAQRDKECKAVCKDANHNLV